MMRLHGLGAARPGVDGGADALAVDTVADTDDHENHLHDYANDCQSGFCALLQMRNGPDGGAAGPFEYERHASAVSSHWNTSSRLTPKTRAMRKALSREGE